MKASNKQQITHRNTSVPKKKRKSFTEKLAIVLAILVVGVGAIVAVATLLPSVASFFNDKQEGEQSVKVQEEMGEYLTGKYTGSFFVAKPERNGKMLGGPEEWKATARPQDDPSIQFTVNATYDSRGSEFIDDYISVVWTKEQNAAILQKAKDTYQDVTSVDISAEVSPAGGRLSRALMTGPLDYEQAVREYPEDLNYKITVKSKNVDASNIEEDIKKAHDIALWVKAQGIQKLWFDYTVETKEGAVKHCLTGKLPVRLTNNFINACFASKGDYAQ